jgi:hypothetical protein
MHMASKCVFYFPLGIEEKDLSDNSYSHSSMNSGVELLYILVCCEQCFLCVVFMYMKGGVL